MGSLIPCRRLRIAPQWILGIGRISSRCDWPVASLATMARMRRNTAPITSPCNTAITPQTDTTRQPSQSSRYLAAMRPAEHTACGYCHRREASSPRYSPTVRPDNHTTDRYHRHTPPYTNTHPPCNTAITPQTDTAPLPHHHRNEKPSAAPRKFSASADGNQ